jgi:hypothetical protein
MILTENNIKYINECINNSYFKIVSCYIGGSSVNPYIPNPRELWRNIFPYSNEIDHDIFDAANSHDKQYLRNINAISCLDQMHIRSYLNHYMLYVCGEKLNFFDILDRKSEYIDHCKKLLVINNQQVYLDKNCIDLEKHPEQGKRLYHILTGFYIIEKGNYDPLNN